MPGAPARVEMPVIDGDKVALVQKQLEKGMIDIRPPFSADVSGTMKEHFQKIAKIKK